MPRLAPDDPKRIRGSTASLDYWARIRRHKRPGEAPPPEWPAKVHPISQEALSLLGLDEHEHLHRDGKPLEIRKRLDLTTGERVLAVIVSGVVVAATVASAYATWQQAVALHVHDGRGDESEPREHLTGADAMQQHAGRHTEAGRNRGVYQEFMEMRSWWSR